MTAVHDWGMLSDAELVNAAAAGNRSAFAAIYDRYADRLHDFCLGMVRNRDTAADCVQDVFCIAAERLSQLRDADKLRPWLYAIARREALRFIRARGRESVVDDLPDLESTDPSLDTMASRSELAQLVADAAGGLSQRDREVLELTYRHGLDGPELAEALDISAASAKKIVQRLRDTVERSLGALLVCRSLRANPDRCAELHDILSSWDGQFTVLMRKRVARHIESCLSCEEERQRRVNPVALLGGAPVFIPAPQWLRERTLRQVQLCGADATVRISTDGIQNAISTGTASPKHGATASNTNRALVRRRVLAALGVGALAAASLMLIYSCGSQKTAPPVAPVDMTRTLQTSPAGSPVAPPPNASTPSTRVEIPTEAKHPVVTQTAPPVRSRAPVTTDAPEPDAEVTTRRKRTPEEKPDPPILIPREPVQDVDEPQEEAPIPSDNPIVQEPNNNFDERPTNNSPGEPSEPFLE